MKQPKLLAPGLKEFHWEDLANLHVDLSYCRHRFIHTVNENLSSGRIANLQALDQLARTDELLKEAADNLERAKAALFNLCYEEEDSDQ